jgi:hypothetical protein
MSYFGTEELANPVDGGQRVFDHVMEQPGGNRHRVELHIRQKVCNRKRMNKIRLTGMADLPAVLEGGKNVRLPKQLDVCIWTVGADFFQQIFEANHENRCLIC